MSNSLLKWSLRTKIAKFLFKSAPMWTNISNHLIFHSKNAELGLGGPRAFPVTVCIACVAELELGVPRAFPVTVCVARTAELELGVPRAGQIRATDHDLRTFQGPRAPNGWRPFVLDSDTPERSPYETQYAY